MSDLIDRLTATHALKAKAVPLYKDPECNDIWERDRTLDNAIDVIRGLPSVDAVEVVRCKDCKYYNPIGVCIEMSSAVCEDSFCCWAERR